MRTLLVGDGKKLCDTVKLQPGRAGYETSCYGQGQEASYYASEYPYDVIILDWMFPQVDGLGVLDGLKKMNVAIPVIIAITLGGIDDRIDGLDAGADNYLVKPYAAGELFTRIRAPTRRPRNFKQSPSATCFNVNLDPEKKEPTGPLGTLQLGKRESALMEYLTRNKGQVLPRGLILSYIWGPDLDMEERNLDNYIYFLKHHLKSIGALLQIKAVHGIGHRLEIGGAYD